MKPLALSLLATSLSVSATPPKVESVKPQDGIYVTYGMHSIVLELKKDRFRYWFSSDVLALKGEEVEYPLEGSFTADGDKIVLQYERFIPLESNWTFKAIDGVVTMWRSDAIKHLTEKDGKVDLFVSGKEKFFSDWRRLNTRPYQQNRRGGLAVASVCGSTRGRAQGFDRKERGRANRR